MALPFFVGEVAWLGNCTGELAYGADEIGGIFGGEDVYDDPSSSMVRDGVAGPVDDEFVGGETGETGGAQ
jgi:hypothetical protein